MKEEEIMQSKNTLLKTIILAAGMTGFSLSGCGGGGNTAPLAHEQNITTNEDEACIITLVGTDANGDALTYTVTTDPTHGTLSNKAPNVSVLASGNTIPTVTYTPATDYHGTDNFKFKVNDGTADSTETTVNITITSVNDAPVSAADTYTTSRAAAAGNIDALSNDTDADGDTLTLQSVTAPSHGGTATINANKIDYTPPADYSGIETFDYTVKDNADATATASVTVTVNKAWDNAPVQLDNKNYTVESPQIAMDDHGKGIAVWKQSDGSHGSIFFNRFVSGTGWGNAALAENYNGGNGEKPQIAMSGNGNAVVVWNQYDGTSWNIYSNNYTDSAGWGAVTSLEGSSYSTDVPQVAMDASGNAIAVWDQYDGSDLSIYTRRYTSSSWGTSAVLIEHKIGNAFEPQIAANAEGNAMAVWRHDDGAAMSTYANEYLTDGTGWGTTASAIETENSDTDKPQVAIDPDGNSMAIWRQRDHNNHWSIYANRHAAGGTSWSTASLIESKDTDADKPQISMDSSGNAITVWYQHDGLHFNIYANHYAPGSGWSTATMISNGNWDAYDPQVVMDSDGNALAVWSQYEDNTHTGIYAARYTAEEGWDTPRLIETGNGDASDPQIAMDSDGNAIAVWKQNNGSRNCAYANHFW